MEQASMHFRFLGFTQWSPTERHHRWGQLRPLRSRPSGSPRRR